MNKVVLIGRLTKDPELKYTPNNKSVCQFTLAVNKFVNGENKADFISCVAWNKTAESLVRYLSKGSQLAVEGSIQTRTYDDANGVKRYVVEVLVERTFFLGKNDNQNQASAGTSYQTNNAGSMMQNDADKVYNKPVENNNPFENLESDFQITNDDLPF